MDIREFTHSIMVCGTGPHRTFLPQATPCPIPCLAGFVFVLLVLVGFLSYPPLCRVLSSVGSILLLSSKDGSGPALTGLPEPSKHANVLLCNFKTATCLPCNRNIYDCFCVWHPHIDGCLAV